MYRVSYNTDNYGLTLWFNNRFRSSTASISVVWLMGMYYPVTRFGAHVKEAPESSFIEAT